MSCFIAAIDDVNDLHCNISRYEAESLLDEKPEGSFLLRDSAQDEYLFSVSFRRYGRSLHARIEEQGHRFSFDCHDPGVFMSRNIPQLLDHYKVRGHPSPRLAQPDVSLNMFIIFGEPRTNTCSVAVLS